MKFEFDPETPVIVLDVEIRSDTSITTKRLALDTGATFVMIPLEVAELLNYEPELSKEKASIITASGEETTRVITLNSVSVLGETAHDVKAVVHDLPPKCLIDGLLGLSFLRNFDLRINFKQGYLELR